MPRTPNKSQHTMLNLEKSILQRERGFFARLCGCQRLSCFCMSQTFVSNACLVLALEITSYRWIMLHNSRPIGAILSILGLLSSFMDILPVSRVLVASSSLEITLG